MPGFFSTTDSKLGSLSARRGTLSSMALNCGSTGLNHTEVPFSLSPRPSEYSISVPAWPMVMAEAGAFANSSVWPQLSTFSG